MLYDFLNSLQCIRQDEVADYRDILNAWGGINYHTAFYPAIFWYGGTCDLFDKKAGHEGENMIWIIPAGQSNYSWLPMLKKTFTDFYKNDIMETSERSYFPGTKTEKVEECILLHSNDLQDEPGKTIFGANAVLIRLSLSSARESLLLVLLDHQDHCWKKIIEGYQISLTWLVDSGRGTDDYFVRTNLYQLMKQSSCPNLLPSLYFKGLYNKGKIPEGFRFLYAMISQPDADGYDEWQIFSAVYETCWGV